MQITDIQADVTPSAAACRPGPGRTDKLLRSSEHEPRASRRPGCFLYLFSVALAHNRRVCWPSAQRLVQRHGFKSLNACMLAQTSSVCLKASKSTAQAQDKCLLQRCWPSKRLLSAMHV